jgi:Type I restriction enzyme R protein N terminus (HSDR_N)
MNLADILKDSNYKLSQFTNAEIEQLERTITLKATKGGDVPYTVCLVRQKAIKRTPEEAIRQLYLQVLTDRLHYSIDRLQVEYGLNFGQELKRADIAVMDKDLLSMPITLPKESTRQKITEKIRESRETREQSKQLLEIVKTGVEREIETDEATATAWINQQIKALGVTLT